MALSENQLADLFAPGGQLDGATVRGAMLYGENYGDGSADGCAVYFRAGARQGLAIDAALVFDADSGDGLRVRLLTGAAAAMPTAAE